MLIFRVFIFYYDEFCLYIFYKIFKGCLVKFCDIGIVIKWRYDVIDFLIFERYSMFKVRVFFLILIKLFIVSWYDFLFIGDMSNFWGVEKKVLFKILILVYVLEFWICFVF